MIEQAKKRATYRFQEIVGEIPSAKLTTRKIELADTLGLSVAQLNRIIRGDSDPSGTQLLTIAEFFGMSVDELFAREEEPQAA